MTPKAPHSAGLSGCLIFGEGDGEVGGFAGVHHDFEHFPGVTQLAGFYLVHAGLQRFNPKPAFPGAFLLHRGMSVQRQQRE